MKQSRHRLTSLSLLLVLLFLTALAVSQQQPPSPVPASAPATTFSAERAMEHLKAIAQKPHPVGSAEHEKVREYLMQQMRLMGLTPETQTGTEERAFSDQMHLATTVTNVMARLKGTNNSKAILLMAHYDSVATGPGASDDGAGVVTELETLGSLNSGAPLNNDVIFLFTDGEELGMMGSKLFWNHHPWAKEVGVVINMEARGSRGASMMFQTSDDNGWLIDAYAKSGARPVTNSVLGDLYRTLPNNTDMTISNELGISGLNFAIGDGWPAYHSREDSIDNIDPASLQHHGDNTYQLVRQLGNEVLTDTKAPDAVYFNLFGQLIHYPKSWVLPITLAVTLLFLGTFFYGIRRGVVQFGKIGLCTLASIGCLLASPLVILVLWMPIKALWAGQMTTTFNGTYYNHLYQAGFITLSIAISAWLFRILRTRLGLLNLFSGSLVVWTLLLWTTTLLMPGASFLFMWPLLIALLVFAFVLRSQEAETAMERPLPLLLTAIPVVLLVVSVVSPFLILLPVDKYAVAILIVVLGLTLLQPQFAVLHRAGNAWLPRTALLVSCILLGTAALTAKHDGEHPEGDNLFYYLNTDIGQAKWISMYGKQGDSASQAPEHAKTDDWTVQFLEQAHVESTAEVLPLTLPVPSVMTHEAPALSLTPPDVTLMQEHKTGDERLVQLHITPTRQGNILLLHFKDPNVTEVSINGKTMTRTDTNSPWLIDYVATPDTATQFEIKSKSSAPIEFTVSEVTDELPSIPGKHYKPRPDYLMPSPEFDASTMVSKTYRF